MHIFPRVSECDRLFNCHIVRSLTFKPFIWQKQADSKKKTLRFSLPTKDKNIHIIIHSFLSRYRLVLHYPFFSRVLCIILKYRKEHMKMWCPLEQISSKNKVEKCSLFPCWCATKCLFLEVLHICKK